MTTSNTLRATTHGATARGDAWASATTTAPTRMLSVWVPQSEREARPMDGATFDAALEVQFKKFDGVFRRLK